MRMPPLATVAATVAICSGVTFSRSWPMPTRPMSTWSESSGRNFSALASKTPLGRICESG